MAARAAAAIATRSGFPEGSSGIVSSRTTMGRAAGPSIAAIAARTASASARTVVATAGA